MAARFLLICCALADNVAVAAGDSGVDAAPAPIVMLDWATGWGDMDPSEAKRVKSMAEAAQRREELARKELAEAREDERVATQKAEEATKGLRGSPAPATVNPVHSKVDYGPTAVPSTASLDSAKEAEMKEREYAEAAERDAQIHMARASAAEEAARQTQDPDDKSEAKERASAELGLAHQAEHNATVKRLEAKVLHEKVRFMQMQTLNGLQIEATSHERYVYMAMGGAIVGLLGLLLGVCRKTRKAGEALKEPLLADVQQEPDWATNDQNAEVSGAEEWRQRALEAMQMHRQAKGAIEQLSADAEQKESALKQQLEVIEKQKAEADDAAANERKEAEAAKKALEELITQTKQDESNSSGFVAALKDRDNKLAIAHAELATLRERLDHSQASLTRCQEESQSAQAAAQQAQTMYDQAVAKVDINAEAEKQRADHAEETVSKLSKELEEVNSQAMKLKSELDASHKQLETERQKTGELEASTQQLRSGLEEADADRKKLREDLGSANADSTETKRMLQDAEQEVQSLSAKVAQGAEQLEKVSGDLDSTKKALAEAEETLVKLKQDLAAMGQDLAETKHAVEQHSQRAQDAERSVSDHKSQLDQAKNSAKDAEQAFEAVRQQAASELADHKKAIEDLHATCMTQEATLATKELEVESEKSRADLAESIAKSRQNEVEAAQQLAEKAKASLQSVRQELTAECSAAKAQVEVERRLALEAEENAEKFRLEAQAARNAEQAARIAEQEAKAALKLVKTAGPDAAIEELRQALSAKTQEVEEAQQELANLRMLPDKVTTQQSQDEEVAEVIPQESAKELEEEAPAKEQGQKVVEEVSSPAEQAQDQVIPQKDLQQGLEQESALPGAVN